MIPFRRLNLLAVILSLQGMSCVVQSEEIAEDTQGLTGADAIRVCASWSATIDGWDQGWQPDVCTTTDGNVGDLVFRAMNETEARDSRLYLRDPRVIVRMGDSPSDGALQELERQGDRILDFIDDRFTPRTQYKRNYTYSGFLNTIDEVDAEQHQQIAQVGEQITSEYRQATDALWKRLDAIYAREVEPKRVVAVERLRRTEDLTSYCGVAQNDVARLRQRLVAVGTSFQAARTRESAVYQSASDLASRASVATLATMPSVQVAVETWYDQVRDQLDQLGADATVAADQADWTLSSIAASFESNADFLAANGLSRPVSDREVGRTLGNVASYAALARSWADQVHEYLLQGIELRKESLLNLEADQQTRDTFAQTALLKASTAFLDEANARINEVTAAFPTTVRLRAPLVAERMNLLSTFLQLEPLCLSESLTASGWRQTGCIALTRQFSRARTTLDRSIPALIKLSVSALRRDGYDATKLKSIEDALLVGNVRAAALAIDAALLAVDSLPPPLPPPLEEAVSKSAPGVGSGETALGRTSSALTEGVARGRFEGEFANREYREAVRAAIPGFIRALRDSRAALTELEAKLVVARVFKLKVLAAVAGANVDEPALLASLDSIANLPAAMRQGVVDTFADIRRTQAQLDERVRMAGTAYAASADRLATVLTNLNTVPGLSDADASAFIPAYPATPLPAIAVPELRLSAPSVDAFTTLVSQYGDGILAGLTRAIVDGQVVDRAAFASTVRAWRRNGALLVEVVAGREASAPRETAALAAQEARIGPVVSAYMDDAGWFRDVPVSADTRALVDGLITQNFPRVAGSLKESINRWSRSASEAKLQETLLAALGRIAALAAPGGMDPATRDLTERLLAAVFERTVSGARLSQGDIIPFCIAVTGYTACDPTQAKVSVSTQMEAALKLPVSTAQFWRVAAQGAPGSGASAAADFIDATSDLTVASRIALNARLQGPALYNLRSSTGAQLNGITGKLGDAVVRTLGANLSLTALQDLHLLSGVRLVDPNAEVTAGRRGAAVKRLGSLVGKTAAAVNSALTAASFTRKSSSATEEVWSHTDGSVVRLLPGGSAELPSRRHLIKQISPSTSTSAASMLCAVTDTGNIVPNGFAEAQKAMSTWYRAPRIAGQSPTAAELRELSAVWLARARIDYVP